MTTYRVPFENGESAFTEKRSRFISHIWRVETEAEARERIEEMKKRYYDARHNCWCYLLQEGGVVRYSDDGEPQGTAGQPMLNVFQRESVTNVCCVVTRYFGGVLLGAGGLTRAYTKGAKDALDAADELAGGGHPVLAAHLRLAEVAVDEDGRRAQLGDHPPQLHGHEALALVGRAAGAVSYTHLTLPTNSRV